MPATIETIAIRTIHGLCHPARKFAMSIRRIGRTPSSASYCGLRRCSKAPGLRINVQERDAST